MYELFGSESLCNTVRVELKDAGFENKDKHNNYMYVYNFYCSVGWESQAQS